MESYVFCENPQCNAYTIQEQHPFYRCDVCQSIIYCSKECREDHRIKHLANCDPLYQNDLPKYPNTALIQNTLNSSLRGQIFNQVSNDFVRWITCVGANPKLLSDEYIPINQLPCRRQIPYSINSRYNSDRIYSTINHIVRRHSCDGRYVTVVQAHGRIIISSYYQPSWNTPLI
jgi:hypothetical protein